MGEKIGKENFGADGKQQQLYMLAISAKRYALFRRDGDVITIVKKSDHGLGHLLNRADRSVDSTAWIDEVWMILIQRALGLPEITPAWLDRPAISRLSISGPAFLAPFEDDSRPYREQIKPFNSPAVRARGTHGSSRRGRP